MVKVKVEQGWLEGERLDLVTGDGQYYSFKGIPYAEPPVGKLRFKAPRPPLPWNDVRKATAHGPICPHKDIFTRELLSGSDDCLYLNVYSPNLTPKSPLAVMIFIHGGGYKSGSGDVVHYGPDFLVNSGVVLVTINYRLDALGFLCLDTEDVPGNAGMKDQVAAMQWVHKNIKSFGGDPNNITIFGESAGGASVALHVISPLSKGLFKRAIPMSGVPNCDWGTAFEPKKRAFALGKHLGFETDNLKDLLEFLQSVPAEKLVDVCPVIYPYEENLKDNIIKMYCFAPVVEKDFGKNHFLTENPLDALRNKRINDVDILIGYTNEEALVAIPFLEAKLIDDYKKHPEILVPLRIIRTCDSELIKNATDIILKRYFGTKPHDMDSMKNVVTYVNESTFIYFIHEFLRLLPKVGNGKRYLYKFSCVSGRNIYGQFGAKYGITGASHLDDTVYLFDPKHANLKIEKNSKEYELVKLTCDLFTNFAKYGNPTPDSTFGVTWPEYDNITEQCGDIGDKLTVGNAGVTECFSFWKSIFDSANIS